MPTGLTDGPAGRLTESRPILSVQDGARCLLLVGGSLVPVSAQIDVADFCVHDDVEVMLSSIIALSMPMLAMMQRNVGESQPE